ncbi:hypothetical protein BHE74_00023666 [Ensete ventricosum]|nr:hypothetical protein BHE74_00023666 [Ensete ventricosum]
MVLPSGIRAAILSVPTVILWSLLSSSSSRRHRRHVAIVVAPPSERERNKEREGRKKRAPYFFFPCSCHRTPPSSPALAVGQRRLCCCPISPAPTVGERHLCCCPIFPTPHHLPTLPLLLLDLPLPVVTQPLRHQLSPSLTPLPLVAIGTLLLQPSPLPSLPSLLPLPRLLLPPPATVVPPLFFITASHPCHLPLPQPPFHSRLQPSVAHTHTVTTSSLLSPSSLLLTCRHCHPSWVAACHSSPLPPLLCCCRQLLLLPHRCSVAPPPLPATVVHLCLCRCCRRPLAAAVASSHALLIFFPLQPPQPQPPLTGPYCLSSSHFFFLIGPHCSSEPAAPPLHCKLIP